MLRRWTGAPAAKENGREYLPMEGHSILPYVVEIALLLMCSAYFSATETAFTSLNRIKIKNKADAGDTQAQRVLRIEQNYDGLLSTILIGNNLVNTAVTATATVLFIDLYGTKGVTISTIVMTIVVLIFGEISPKSLAKEAPERFAIFSAPLIGFLCFIMTPINYLFSLWKALLSAIFKTKAARGITKDELATVVDEAYVTGGIDESQNHLIQNAINFGDLEAQDVLTPRVDIQAIDRTTPNEKIDELFRESGFSRLPVYEEDIDNILGVLTQKDFHNEIFGRDRKVEDVMKPVIYVAASIKVADLLKRLQDNKCRMAVVIDEYGGTLGLVTAEDIVEELVGEIYDAGDTVAGRECTRMQDGSYRVLGSLNVEKLFDSFGEDCSIDATTVNGWAAIQLDKLPAEGDCFTYRGRRKTFTVKVLKADDRKALELSVRVFDPEAEHKEGETLL